MPTALDDATHKAASVTTNPESLERSLQAIVPESACDRREASVRLMRLLFSAPFDLAAISDEIRSLPGLESLVMRLGEVLVMSPETPASTIEEAVVVLGTDRLRVLTDLWSAGEIRLSAQEATSVASRTANMPEIQYLTNFIRCLGFESLEEASSGVQLSGGVTKMPSNQMAALTDLFMRDFFSLLPVLQPDIQEAGAGPAHR